MKKLLAIAALLLGFSHAAIADIVFPPGPYGSSSGSSGGSAVTSVTASSPLASSGGTTPNITITSPLPVANGGTATSTAFTAGSVVFSTSSGVYFQDNSNFFYNATNHRLGLGNTTPAVTLDLRNLAIAFSSSTINGVSYTWPGSQGSASTFLSNDGSGNLTWTAATTYSAGTGLTLSGGAFSITAPVTVALGGTGTTTVFTSGSVAFSTSTGAYFQDNAQLFWNDTTHRLGIGNNTPAVALDVRNLAIAVASTTINNVAYTWPGAHGTAGQVLTDAGGNGALTWVSPTAGITGTAANTQMTYWSGTSSITGDSSLTYVPNSSGNSDVNTLIMATAFGNSASNNVHLKSDSNTGSVNNIFMENLDGSAAGGNAVYMISNGGNGVTVFQDHTSLYWEMGMFGSTKRLTAYNYTTSANHYAMSLNNADKGFGIYVQVPATDTFEVGIATQLDSTLSVDGGGHTLYYCTGSTGGTFDGNIARGNGNAGACAGGTWTAIGIATN